MEEDNRTVADHKYDAPELPALIMKALGQYVGLAETLHSIQEATKIPGLHMNVNSQDDTPGVLERISYMHDCYDYKLASISASEALEAFMGFDNSMED